MPSVELAAGLHLAGSVEEASTVAGADAVLILTEWQQYRQLNWQALAALMRKPAWVFDARAVLRPIPSRCSCAAGLTLTRGASVYFGEG